MNLLPHPGKALPHVSNDVHNYTSMLLHPCRIDCVNETSQNQYLLPDYSIMCSLYASYLPDSNGKFQSGWCQSQLSSLWGKYVLLGCWTDLHHYSPESLSCHIASTLMTQVPSPYRHMRKSNHHRAVFAAANNESTGGRLWESAPRSHFGCYTEGEQQMRGWQEGVFVSSPELLPPAVLYSDWR